MDWLDTGELSTLLKFIEEYALGYVQETTVSLMLEKSWIKRLNTFKRSNGYNLFWAKRS